MPRRKVDLLAGIVTKGALPPKITRRGRRPLIPRVLTLPEAAAILRLSVDRTRTYFNTGRLRGFRMGLTAGGGWRTTDLDILAFMGWETPGHSLVPPKPRADGTRSGADRNRPQALAVKRGEDPSAVARAMRLRRAEIRRERGKLVLPETEIEAAPKAQDRPAQAEGT